MKKDTGHQEADGELSASAQECVAENAAKPPSADGTADSMRLLQESQIHQAELELQNEELRQARLALEAALEKYADLYDFAPMGYFTLDEAGLVVETNQTGISVLGAARPHLVGHRFSIFLAEQSRIRFSVFLGEVFGGAKKAVCEVALWGGPPHVQWVRIHGSAENTGEGEPRRCRIAVTDITALKEAEREQGLLQAQIQQTQRMESLGVLAGGIAHDFNNLLMAISGNAGLALEELAEDSPARPMLQEIVTVAGRAADLCTQMLAYAGRGPFRMAPLDLSKMAAEMSHLLTASTSKKAVISCRLLENLPPVRADGSQIRQVLMNLIMNASEAVGESGGSISVSTGIKDCNREYLSRALAATPLKEGPYVFLEVTDTGCGMTRDIVAKMFDPFFSTKSPGRGLGLSTVMGIIHAHAGGICVDTEPDRGTAVTLLFPPAQAIEAAPPAPSRSKDLFKGKGTVLLVDDEETVRTVYRHMLQHLGLEVMVANDGREALAIFDKHHDSIRCVLLDFVMPRLNGEEAFREMRKIDPAACVILSSGYLVDDVMARFEGQGLAGFIHKPYLQEQLVEVLKKVFAE